MTLKEFEAVNESSRTRYIVWSDGDSDMPDVFEVDMHLRPEALAQIRELKRQGAVVKTVMAGNEAGLLIVQVRV